MVKLVQSMGIAVEAAKALGNNSASQEGVKKFTQQIVKTNDRKQTGQGEGRLRKGCVWNGLRLRLALSAAYHFFCLQNIQAVLLQCALLGTAPGKRWGLQLVEGGAIQILIRLRYRMYIALLLCHFG